jgi:3-hydroxyisobutyrate dehydrogenase
VSKIALLGLGNMGTPMARRLMHAGHDLTVWNRTIARTVEFADAGALVAATPAEAADGVDLAITMLANPDALDDVLFASDGLANALSRGQTLIDMSTVGPDAFRAAAALLPTGVLAIDAPVRGSIPEAINGLLQIYVGASDDAFERVQPVLAVLGEVHHVGPSGTGAAIKLVLNTALIESMVTLGETLALSRALGIDQSVALDLLAESPVGATVHAKRANVESGHYPPNFKLSLAAKDMCLAVDAADQAQVDLEAAKTVRHLLYQAGKHGADDLDFSAVVATITGVPPQA